MDEKILCVRCQHMVHEDEAALECVHEDCPFLQENYSEEMIAVDLFMDGHRTPGVTYETELPDED